MSNFLHALGGSLGYAAAALAYLLLFVLLIASWRGRIAGLLLAIAGGISVLWAAASAARTQWGPLPADLLEAARALGWYAFLFVLLGHARRSVRPLRRLAIGSAIACLAVAGLRLASALTDLDLRALFVLGYLLLSVIGMVLIEQLYRNIHPQQRWMIKFLCFGLGGLFVCDFYLYSDALLFRRLDESVWIARGIVNLLAVPFLAVAVTRNPRWSLDIFVSRGIVFHTSTLLGTAAYLLVMAAIGYYIRYFGGTWGAVVQVVFVFAALQLLLIMLFSGSIRARAKVFLNKHFFAYRYDYREEWMRFTRALSEGEPSLQRERSIQAIADLVDSPAGMLWLEHGDRFEPSARWNMAASSGHEPASGSLARFLASRQWVIDVDEYETQPEGYEDLKLPQWLRTISGAWLIVPLVLRDRLLGFVVLAHSRGRMRINWEVRDLLKSAGRQAASFLAQIEAAKALVIARQFESFNRMSAFVVHDLKNLIAQLSLLIANAERHGHKREFQEDMLQTVSNSVEKMKRLLFQLRGYSIEPPTQVDLRDLLAQVVAARSEAIPRPVLAAATESAAVVAHRSRLERVIGHLVQNAIEATPPTGRVDVSLQARSDQAIITIADNGSGMTDEFRRTRLFHPFESTKTSGMGIGTYETDQYVRELGGRIEVDSVEGHGSTFRIWLPVTREANGKEPSPMNQAVQSTGELG